MRQFPSLVCHNLHTMIDPSALRQDCSVILLYFFLPISAPELHLDLPPSTLKHNQQQFLFRGYQQTCQFDLVENGCSVGYKASRHDNFYLHSGSADILNIHFTQATQFFDQISVHLNLKVALLIQFVEESMSHFNYNLHKLTKEEQQERFEVISKLAGTVPYFCYLPYISNPTNNYLKYSNTLLNSFILEFTYGNIEADYHSEDFTILYQEFIKDYTHNIEIYVREKSEQNQRQYEQQMAAMKFYATTQSVSYYADGQQAQQYPPQQGYGQYSQQQQGYGRRHEYHQQKPQEHYQQQHHPHHQYDPNHDEHHLWHKYHTKSGDIITFESRKEYEEFLSFKERYSLEIEVKYDPETKFEDEGLIAAELGPLITNLSETEPKTLPQPIPQPVVIPKPPKSDPKPHRFTIEEIKQFINLLSKEELEKHVNPELLAQTKEISEWRTEEIQVEQKDPRRGPGLKRKPTQTKKYDGKQTPGVRTYVDQAEVAKQLGYKPVEKKLQINFSAPGKYETLEARIMKKQIKSMAGKDFASLKEKEMESLDSVEKSRKEIIYNLNLIVPENLKSIEKDVAQFLFDDINVCRTLIEEIIKKAWNQPKYASTYAKLCSDFCKRQLHEFKFEGITKEKEGKKRNPFKYFLIESVQHSFDQKIEKFPEFQTPEDKETFLKDKKKNILSNVKFIAELIIHKVLKKRTINYCISQLLESFLKHYYNYCHDNKIEDSVYAFHFEAIIEFIENIGEVYEELGEKEKEADYDYAAIKTHVGAVISLAEAPNISLPDQIKHFNGDQYFKLLAFINDSFIRQAFPRLSALLQNLVERRGNKWQKHLSSSEGPKKLKEIQEDILREEDDTQGKGKEKLSKEKMDLQKLDKKVKELFEGWEMDKKEEQREIKDILRKATDRQFYFSFLKQVADEKKDNVVKRVALFPVLLAKHFNFTDFKKAWFDIIKYLAIGSGDYPYCVAALAQVLQHLLEKEGTIDEMWRKYNEDEEEDELYFIEEVFQKYYHYSKDENALKYVKPKNKLNGLI